MLKIEQNWGKIANYPSNAQQRSAPLYSPKFKRFFGPKTGDLQKKKNANTTFSNQNALWSTAKYFCGPPMGHGPQVGNH